MINILTRKLPHSPSTTTEFVEKLLDKLGVEYEAEIVPIIPEL